MEPRISVIMAVYNGERYLREAVDSILDQSLPDLELIVVNDGSSDETPEILASYTDPRVRVLHSERNVGPAAARSKAIRAARAEYIAVQDADDVALPMRLEKQICFLEKSRRVALVGSHAIMIDEQGNQQGLMAYPPADDRDIKWDLLFHNPFIHSSVVFRRSVLEVTGLYSDDPDICRAFVEDYELVSRVNRVAESANIPEPLEKYRLNPIGASARTSAEQQRQMLEVSKRNICWLLDWSTTDASCWEGPYRFLYNPSQQPLDWKTSEALRTMTFLDAVYRSFCTKYRFSKSEIHEHRARVFTWWAKHALALSLRKNGNRSLFCRLALLRWGVSLTGRMVVSEFARSLERTRHEKGALSTRTCKQANPKAF